MSARPFALLYGAPGNVPYPSLNWLQAPGCGFVLNRQWVQGTEDWCRAGRAAGMEVLYYTNLMEVPTGWTFAGEEQQVYGGFTSWSQLPDDWFWTGSRATASQRVNFSGHYMLNIRPGSPWWTYVLDTWLPSVLTRRAGLLDGLFLDVLGNRLWVSVWSGTMTTTTDAYAGDGRKEAENWIRGVHWGLTQMRDVLGPEAVLVANNLFNTRNLGSGMPNLPSISGGDATMAQGGHRALNGCMFEGANGSQHPVATVAATVAKDPIGDCPEGFEWAEDAQSRYRHMILSSRSTGPTDLQAYTGIDAWIGAAPSGYTSSSQSQVTGTSKTAWPDHQQGWTWTAPGGGGDTTPPAAPSAFSAGPPDGSDVPLTWTLPTDADRASFIVARKASSWGASEQPEAGTAVVTQSPGADGAGSATEVGVPDGTWHYKAFTRDAAGNTNLAGSSSTVVVSTASTVDPVAHFRHTFDGVLGDPPDQDVWTDPDLRKPGAGSSSTGALDGAGALALTMRANVQGTYGSVVVQRREPIDLGQSARRCLRVLIGLEGPAGASASFYLVGPGDQGDGSGLTNVYGHPNWVRLEQLGTSFRVVRKVNGALATLYSGAAPTAGPYEVAVLIGPDDWSVRVAGVEVVPLQPRTPDFTPGFSTAFLYLEAATNDAGQDTVATFALAEMFRATPTAPTGGTAGVSGGQTDYSADAAPADEGELTWRWFIDGALQAQAAGPAAVGAELAAGTYTLGVQTENASPFTEPEE